MTCPWCGDVFERDPECPDALACLPCATLERVASSFYDAMRQVVSPTIQFPAWDEAPVGAQAALMDACRLLEAQWTDEIATVVLTVQQKADELTEVERILSAAGLSHHPCESVPDVLRRVLSPSIVN